MAQRLLILGLDGAGFDFVSRLCAEGHTPNLRALAVAGALGPLRATTPPITGPAWLGLASGLAPDQTGVADFLVRRAPATMRPISSRDFRGRAFWEPIGAAGGRVAVVNFPILFPPYPVNGVMVSGFGADESTQWTYPETLKSELLEVAGRGYSLTVNYHHDVYGDAIRLLDDLEASLERRIRIAEHVCRRHGPWDLFFLVLSETDWLLHRVWADLHASHPAHDPARSPAVAERALGFWSRVDAVIPRLIEAMGPDTGVLVCSDHGFGANTKTIKINLLLEREGLLARRPSAARRGASLRRAAEAAAKRAGAASARLGGPVGRALALARRRARRLLPRDDSAYLAATIDFDRSAAFDPGHTIPFGGLYVSPRVERGGTQYEREIERVEACLGEFAAKTGVSLEWRRTWLDAGGRAETLPDLLVWGDDWACTFSKADFEGEVLVEGPFSTRHTGSHRELGIYLASGGGFEKASSAEASILDVAPTVLAYFGLAAPPDRRGRVLHELLGRDTSALTPAPQAEAAADSEATRDEEDDVRERLKGLGYIE